MKAMLRFVLVIAVVGTNACVTPDNSPKGVKIGTGVTSIEKVETDLSDAKELFVGVDTSKSSPSRSLFKKIEEGKYASVFPDPAEIEHYAHTKTHIILQVNYVRTNSEGKKNECHLIALPLKREKTEAICLSTNPLISEELRKVELIKNRRQFDVRDESVYFSVVDTNGTYTELRVWDGKSQVIETIFHAERVKDKFPDIFQVFASVESENLCFTTSPLGEGTLQLLQNQMFCKQSSAKGWVHTELDATRALRWKDSLFTEKLKISLKDLKTEPRAEGNLPEVFDEKLNREGFIGHTNGKVYCVNDKGESKFIYDTGRSTKMALVANDAWFFGSQTLKRMDLYDCKLDPAEYFTNVDLLFISYVSWSEKDFLRVDGNSREGLPMARFLTETGNVMFSKTSDIIFEHPIPLVWEK